jgi:putative ABC transport system permease protein
VKYVSPSVQRRGSISAGVKSKFAIITGGNTEKAYIDNVELLHGRYFNEREFLEGRLVIVMDDRTAKHIFGRSDVIGESVKIGTNSFSKKVQIIGVFKGFPDLFMKDGSGIPAFITTPLTTLAKIHSGEVYIDTASIMAGTREEGEAVAIGAKSFIESRHRNRKKEVYRAESAMEQLEEVGKIIDTFTAFIGAVAAISLIVGGIGVMNIMLVSVTERTREIGIRKALGATTSAILTQFLMEAIIISATGGIMGMAIGIAGAFMIGGLAEITPFLSAAVILGTILFSTVVGIFFGLYPALKAAKLDPIEALRYE